MREKGFIRAHSVLSAIVLVVLIGGPVGCASGWFAHQTLSESDEHHALVSRILQSRKESSLVAWGGQRIGDKSTREAIGDRVTLLVRGQAAITFRNVELNDEGQATSFSTSVKFDRVENPHSSYGSATAITDDGYFLTSAHVISEEFLFLIGLDETMTSPGAFRARIVWNGSGSPESAEPDLALLHAPVRLLGHFPLESGAEPAPGTLIITAGFGVGSRSQAGGKILGFGPWETSKSGARWRDLIHDAPVGGGDSGGVVANAEGRLLGITEEIHAHRHLRLFGRDFLTDYHATAVSPDPEWLRQLIQKDRAQSL